MCGIAGLLLNGLATPRAARLDGMVEALAHRGPDDRGTHIDGPVGLGSRRLSIIDVAGGHQPITNEDRTVWVVYNGECYNFRELRSELQAAGHRFATGADTEVIVHGYEEWGSQRLAQRLDGIFAFCVWDRRQQVAHLVRDRVGVKPLYYVSRASGLAFSSELRSLARSGLCLPKLDEEAVWGYLLRQFPATERTPLAGVVRLLPGHLLTWEAASGSVKIERYWDFPQGGTRHDIPFARAAREVHEILDQAVAGQMVSDVPIGCYLSGGLDSTAVAALMARHSTQPVRTFSVGFPGSGDYDETPWAELAAQAIGTRHTTVAFDEKVFLAHVQDYLAHVDEPIADAAMLPTYVLSKTASRDVKVVLTGEGADEVFGGYAYYRSLGAAPGETSGALRDRAEQVRRLTAHLGIPFPSPAGSATSPHSGFPYTAPPEFLWCLLHPDRRPSLSTFSGALRSVEERWLESTRSHTPLQRALYLDTKIWLGNDLMTKLDKSTMAHGIEGRVPMLDHRLIEYAFNLPDGYKVGPDAGKLVLRAAVRTLVPSAILDRPKRGFGVPIDAWFRTSLRDLVRSVLTDSVLVEEGLLTRPGVEAVLFAHQELGLSMGRLIWSLVNLDRWWRSLRREIGASLPDDGAVARVSTEREPSVDVVIPVYESLSLVRDCIRSIRAFTRRPFRAFVVDDGSNSATHQRLRRIVEGDSRFVLVRNEENVGFVRTCRRGMSLSDADYVVLLNSDTVVTPGWLERMVSCAESDPRIAAVNPLTNESGNTSVRFAPGLNLLSMARRVAALSRRDYPDLTTGVGMCLLLRRTALELLGGFDLVFGDGVCEESDLCMRFTEAGLRVVAADDAFIYHKGEGTYGRERKNLLYEQNRRIFDQRWAVPYERDWSAYERRDPLQYMRDALHRGTVGPGEAPFSETRGEASPYGLDTRRALVAVGSGERTSAAVAALRDGVPAGAREGLRERAIASQQKPLARFGERAHARPTRAYVSALPAPPPAHLRITFLIDGLPLAGGVISILQLAREMLLAGHDVKFATESAGHLPELFNLWLEPLVYRDPAHLVDAFPASDVVVATYWTTAHLYLAELRRRYSFVSAYFIQDYEAWFYPDEEYERQRDVVRSYALAEHHIVKSRWLADLVGRHGPKCEIVPLGLDLAVFYPRDGKRAARPRVVSVASPGARRRGFLETVEAFRLIHAAQPEVELVLFGAEAVLPELPFPCTYAGRIDDQQKVAELLSSADVLLDASLWQGFGRPGLEAMACGTVPVLTNAGGMSEYARDRENCLLVPPRDPAAAAAAVLRLLGDADLRGRLRARGPATAARFSHEVEAQRHLALYRRWVEEKRAAEARSPRGRPA